MDISRLNPGDLVAIAPHSNMWKSGAKEAWVLRLDPDKVVVLPVFEEGDVGVPHSTSLKNLSSVLSRIEHAAVDAVLGCIARLHTPDYNVRLGDILEGTWLDEATVVAAAAVLNNKGRICVPVPFSEFRLSPKEVEMRLGQASAGSEEDVVRSAVVDTIASAPSYEEALRIFKIVLTHDRDNFPEDRELFQGMLGEADKALAIYREALLEARRIAGRKMREQGLNSGFAEAVETWDFSRLK